MNCWEVKKCGREEGGVKAEELGVCPAYTEGAGEACWMVAGTFCDGEVQSLHAKEIGGCMSCSFYQSFQLEHKAVMQMEFGHLKTWYKVPSEEPCRATEVQSAKGGFTSWGTSARRYNSLEISGRY